MDHFVPAGFAFERIFRRRWTAIGALAALSLAIEFTQRRLMLGTGDPADLIANVVGACLGAVTAVVVSAVSRA